MLGWRPRCSERVGRPDSRCDQCEGQLHSHAKQRRTRRGGGALKSRKPRRRGGRSRRPSRIEPEQLSSLCLANSTLISGESCLSLHLTICSTAHDILVREAFTIKGHCGEGVIEQIDGLIELDGHLYLVEMKWWNAPIGVGDIAPHLVRVFSRGGQARGLFISYTDFTEPAITQCRRGDESRSLLWCYQGSGRNRVAAERRR